MLDTAATLNEEDARLDELLRVFSGHYDNNNAVGHDPADARLIGLNGGPSFNGVATEARPARRSSVARMGSTRRETLLTIALSLIIGIVLGWVGSNYWRARAERAEANASDSRDAVERLGSVLNDYESVH